MIAITNDFTGKITSVNPALPMTRRKADAVRARLCSPSCSSGDDLGARGPQVEGYSDLLQRAQAAIMSGDIR